MGTTRTKPGQTKTILNNVRTAGNIAISYFKLYYGAVVIKTAWCWHKNRHAHKLN